MKKYNNKTNLISIYYQEILSLIWILKAKEGVKRNQKSLIVL